MWVPRYAQNREQGRESRTPKGDVNSTWSHDLFEGNRSLSERLSSSSSSGAPKANFGIAQKALRDAVGTEESASGGLNIKGASSVKDGNVVQVSGLVKGTTAADVEVRHCCYIKDKNFTTCNVRQYLSAVDQFSPQNSILHPQATM